MVPWKRLYKLTFERFWFRALVARVGFGDILYVLLHPIGSHTDQDSSSRLTV